MSKSVNFIWILVISGKFKVICFLRLVFLLLFKRCHSKDIHVLLPYNSLTAVWKSKQKKKQLFFLNETVHSIFWSFNLVKAKSQLISHKF